MKNALIRALRDNGVDVVSALEEGLSGRDDEENLIHATRRERVLFSFNVGDFQDIHTQYMEQGKSHTGIILAAQQRFSVGDQLRRLLKLIETKSAEEMIDQLEFLGRWG